MEAAPRNDLWFFLLLERENISGRVTDFPNPTHRQLDDRIVRIWVRHESARRPHRALAPRRQADKGSFDAIRSEISECDGPGR
jgi:hypothetical protein